MHRYALALTIFAMFVGLSGCSSNLGGLLDATVVELGSPEADVKALATADEQDPCPDLSDPNAPPDVYVCQLLARIEYLLGLIDCDEYKKRVKECTPI